MSSRNQYLEGEQRRQAVALSQAIGLARAAVQNSPQPAFRLAAQLKGIIEKQPEARVDYISFFEPETLKSVREVTRGSHIALAVFIGKTRLIDNGRL